MTTGWVWDERYMWHYTGRRGRSLPGREWVEPEDHAESPATKRRLRNLVEVSGLLGRLVPIAVTPAGREALLRVHTAEYVDRVAALSGADGGDAGENTPFAAGGEEIAKLAVGGCMAAADAVVDGRVDNCYALVRPPGHHAEPARGRGYCIFANVAIAVRHVQALRGIERVAVIDWDVHHGNGTQAIFWRDPTVLALSVHQDGYYPAESGASDEIGGGPGAGATVNIPLPAGSGVGAYVEAFQGVCGSRGPAAPAGADLRQLRGFDPSMLEPRAQMMVHSDGFRELTRIVLDLAAEVCEGKLVVCHEGGGTRRPMCPSAAWPWSRLWPGSGLKVRDPYLEVFRAVRGQELQPHQAEAIESAAARVLG